MACCQKSATDFRLLFFVFGQMSFQMRCRVTGTKVNQKNRYDSHECEESGLTDESQDHVLNCKGIIDMHGEIEISEIPPYENIMEGNVNEQANICKIFSKHLKILQNLKKKVKWREMVKNET